MPIVKSEQWRAWWPRLLFLASALTLAAGVAQIVPLPLLHPFQDYKFFDLRIYRAATWVVHIGRPLYSTHLRHGLGFTYPPFAVLAMLPLRWVSVFHDEELVTLINIVLVAVCAHAAARLGGSENRARAGWVAAAIALWSEPILSTVGYGQIDLVIAALVVADLAYGGRSRAGGIGIGLAAAMKLTPLIFIPYLLFSHRGVMAGRALGTFLFTIIIAFIAVPRDAAQYWGGAVFNVGRVEGHNRIAGYTPVNQSLRGALVRMFPGMEHLSSVWMPICLVVGCIGLVIAVLAARRGNELHGFLLTALTGLLISPVSWTHHWAMVAPGAIVLATSRRQASTRRMLTLLAAELAVASSAIWLVTAFDPNGRPLGTAGWLASNVYVLAALAAIGAAAWIELQRAGANGPWRGLARVRRQSLRVIPEGISGP